MPTSQRQSKSLYKRRNTREERFQEGNGHDCDNNGAQESVNPRTRLP